MTLYLSHSRSCLCIIPHYRSSPNGTFDEEYRENYSLLFGKSVIGYCLIFLGSEGYVYVLNIFILKIVFEFM